MVRKPSEAIGSITLLTRRSQSFCENFFGAPSLARNHLHLEQVVLLTNYSLSKLTGVVNDNIIFSRHNEKKNQFTSNLNTTAKKGS